jgi:hypothetical protein
MSSTDVDSHAETNEPLGRRQRLEHDEQREAAEFGEVSILGARASSRSPTGSPTLRPRLLAPYFPGGSSVEADTRDDRRQPPPGCRRRSCRRGAGGATPNGVVGSADVPSMRRRRFEGGAVGLELGCDSVVVVHRSHSPFALRQQ